MSSLVHQETECSVRSQVTAEEWQTREDLAAAYRLVDHYGWDDMVFTHLSARVPGKENHFLLNPFGYLFREVTASNLVKVDVSGEVVLDNGQTVNKAGFTIHSAVHGARTDAHAVMHLHSDAGSAVSCMEVGLLPISQHALFAHQDLAYHDWEGVALDLDERARIVADLGDKHFMMLRNHGTLTLGESVAECFMRLYYLERACRIQVDALSGGQPNQPRQSALQRMKEDFGSSEAWAQLAEIGWPALVRLVKDLYPDYRT